MLTLPFCSVLFLLTTLSSVDLATLQVSDWNDLDLTQRLETTSAAWEGQPEPWLEFTDAGRRVARTNGDLLVVYASLESSSVDLNITMESNAPQPLDRPITLVEMPKAKYPDAAMDLGLDGYVPLRCRVAPSGKVDLIVVPRGEEVAYLTDAAINAVEQATFSPAMQGDEVVSAWKLVPFQFVLGETEVAAR